MTTRPTQRLWIGLELAIVAVLAAWFLATRQTRAGYVDLLLALLALALIVANLRRSARLWQAIGGGGDVPKSERLSAASRTMALFTLPVLAAFFLIGGALGYSAGGWEGAWARVGNWHVIAACLLYFPWALLQQFIFQFYLLGRLLHVLPLPAAVLATAIAFALVHFPRTPVMALTAAAGLVWSATYVKHRALLPLAVSHALLGTSLHYWIFARDLLAAWL